MDSGEPEIGNPKTADDEVAAAIAFVLAGGELPAGVSQEEALTVLLMKLPDPLEEEAAREAAKLALAAQKGARMVLAGDDGQS